MAEIAGLKLIVPSSVAGTGVSVSASGKVTFTAATSVSVNGCFSSTYDNYLIVVRCLGSTDIGVDARLRTSGTDASGTDYTTQENNATNTSVTASRATSQTFARQFQARNTQDAGAHIHVYGPALAQPTAFRSVFFDPQSTGVDLSNRVATHSLSTAYDGISFILTSGNITGALTIYGLSQ